MNRARHSKMMQREICKRLRKLHAIGKKQGVDLSLPDSCGSASSGTLGLGM